MELSFANNEQMLTAMLESFFLISNEIKDKTVGDKEFLLDAEGLAIKYVFHTLSALHLTKGTYIEDLNINYPDFASINVLARAALETFLVFDYVFMQPENKDEFQLRYLSWCLHGLLDKEKIVDCAQSRKQDNKELKSEIGFVKDELKRNKYFLGLADKRKKSILKGYYRPSWRKMGLLAGLSRVSADYLYKYLCNYAHASNYSVRQIYSAHIAEEQKQMYNSSINLLVMVTAIMAKRYMKLFSIGDMIFDQNKKLLEALNFYYELGITRMDSL